MIQIHHLNNSRSQRVLWLLEELELEYEIVPHQRDAQTQLAPDSLRAVHPLGKSPVLRDGELLLIETGAILDYLVRRYGAGLLAPKESSPDYPRYLQFLHYAEGSAMLPLMLNLYASRLGEAAEPLRPRIASELDNHFGFLDAELGHANFFVGSQLSAADVNLSFPIQLGRTFKVLDKFSNLARFIAAMESRPAYLRALERGGPYAFGS